MFVNGQQWKLGSKMSRSKFWNTDDKGCIEIVTEATGDSKQTMPIMFAPEMTVGLKRVG